MPNYNNATLNRAFMRLTRRSERVDRAHLVDTFVNVGPLITLVSSDDHQVIFGRRGTGKTHVLNFLSDSRVNAGDVVVYVELSNIGSSGGIYSDQNIPLTERATRLLVDTLLYVHSALYDYFVEHAEDLDLSVTGPLLDRFADSITQVRVVGDVEVRSSTEESKRDTEKNSAGLKLTPKKVELGISSDDLTDVSQKQSSSVGQIGKEQYVVHFGATRKEWEAMIKIIHPRKVWLLLDEWSSLPIELQPYLADLIRRSIFPVRGVVVKIAAIEYRTTFACQQDKGNYIGIELGADAAADVNLDDFMVFDNDSNSVRAFYRSLLFKHVQATDVYQDAKINIGSEDDFLSAAFTQVNTFDELVRAAEGVPRDAINIVIQAAQFAGSSQISVEHVRRAAHAWYQRDKESAVKSNEKATELLHWIVNQVIGGRRARAFLLRSDAKDNLIEALFDARVLHILKKNISTHDEPGVRYNVYKLDYGCYVDLMVTGVSPQGLLPLDDLSENGHTQYIEVPPDDYRAIRRAVLRVEDFYKKSE